MSEQQGTAADVLRGMLDKRLRQFERYHDYDGQQNPLTYPHKLYGEIQAFKAALDALDRIAGYERMMAATTFIQFHEDTHAQRFGGGWLLSDGDIRDTPLEAFEALEGKDGE